MSNQVYVHLYHGRKPGEELDDWGSEGPTFGPFENVQITYRDHIKMHLPGYIGFQDLCWTDDLTMYYDGVYYGDVTIFTGPPKGETTAYQEYKANPPALPREQEHAQEVVYSHPLDEWAKAIAERINDDATYAFDDDGTIENVLAQALARCPDLCKQLIGTTVIEEDYFERLS